jgi:hypothetical protein
LTYVRINLDQENQEIVIIFEKNHNNLIVLQKNDYSTEINIFSCEDDIYMNWLDFHHATNNIRVEWKIISYEKWFNGLQQVQ